MTTVRSKSGESTIGRSGRRRTTCRRRPAYPYSSPATGSALDVTDGEGSGDFVADTECVGDADDLVDVLVDTRRFFGDRGARLGLDVDLVVGLEFLLNVAAPVLVFGLCPTHETASAVCRRAER